jgi:hypothetical protein
LKLTLRGWQTAMMQSVPQSDWKLFKKLREAALQRLCERALNDVAEVAADPSHTPHERYRQVYQRIQKYDEQIASAFNAMRRSRMIIQLMQMRSLKLIGDAELEPFTQETKDTLSRWASVAGE